MNRSLNDIDGDRFTPKTSMPCCYTTVIPSGLHSLLTHGSFPTIANIANRDQSSSYISPVTGNHPTSTGLCIAKHHSILHLNRIHRILSGQGKDSNKCINGFNQLIQLNATIYKLIYIERIAFIN